MKKSSNEVDRKVYEILLLRAQNKQGTITYKNLAEVVGLDIQGFFMKWLSPILKALKRIDERSRETGTPRLVALVVRASTGIPGNGYWRSSPFPAMLKTRLECHCTEVAAVLRHYAH